MTAYYNENDPKAAAWLRELIKKGYIASGDVDERSIEDVIPNDLRKYTQCHFFAGIGGWSYALRLAQWPDDKPVWTGSCPCQPFSEAGKGAGFADERHLWPALFHLVRTVRPKQLFGEQVAKYLPWIDLVQTDMEAEGYSVGYAVLGAHSVSKPHTRQRLYWMASTTDYRRSGRGRKRSVAEPLPEFKGLVPPTLQVTPPSGPYLLSDDGVPDSMVLLRGFGNAIVPQAAAAFIEASGLV